MTGTTLGTTGTTLGRSGSLLCPPYRPRCWGRHLGMLGKTIGDVGEDRNIGKDTQGYRGGHQGGWG